MTAERNEQLSVVADLVQQFGLTSLLSTVRACERLSGDEPLDVAVLGQFKSGKSSLLNALLDAELFPVGVLPVTAVITRALAGPNLSVRVHHLDGSSEDIDPEHLREYVTETGNPRNRRQVAVVDVFTPALQEWPGLRLVDTPGLGSVFAHNTQATHDWLPNMAVALVVISADRPLSEEDRRLLDEARQHAPRIAVVLTKVDLLTPAEQREVLSFLDDALQERNGKPISVLPFSAKTQRGQWVARFKEAVLQPLVRNLARERQESLLHKRAYLIDACRSYLTMGLQAAERADADRAQLRAAVLDESVNATMIRDELRLAEQRVNEETRPIFEKFFFTRRATLVQQVMAALDTAVRTWQGNLAQQTQRLETWLAAQLKAVLTPLSQQGAPLGAEQLRQAEIRFQRIIEAFRDRLSRNIRDAMGITVSPAAWEAQCPTLAPVPIAVGRTFMVNWELLWWLLPMWLIGGLFRRHALGLIPWEVEKNLSRLTSDWSAAVKAAVADLRQQAVVWVDSELNTLERFASAWHTQ